MAKGYPTESGPYWVKMYGWSYDTRKYDQPGEWRLAEVDTRIDPEFQVSLIEDEIKDDVRKIYEYQIIGRPKSD